MEITSGQPAIQVGGGYGNGMFGGDTGIMFLAFLAMMGGFGGFGGRGPGFVPTGDQAPASSAQLQNSMNFNDLQDQNRDINNNVNNVYHDLATNLSDKYGELQRDIAANAVTLANLQASNQQCCCQIKQEIAAQTLRTTEQFAALNSKMDQSEIQRLRDALAQQSQNIQDLKADMRAMRPAFLPGPVPVTPGF